LDSLIERARPGVHSADAGLIHYLHFQVVVNANLAREANVIGELRFHSETIALKFTHLPWIAGENLDAAGGATSIATTAVQDVDPRVFEDEYQLLSFGGFNGLSARCGYGFNVWHALRTP
jgi:hypothetical protein